MHDDAWAIEQQIRRFAMLEDAHDHDASPRCSPRP